MGIFPTLLTVPLFWSIYWSTYTQFKQTFQEQLPNSPPFVHHILSAISAGAIGDIVTNPLWVARTRMQTYIFHGSGHPVTNITTFGMIRSIYKNEGLGAFYRGLGASFLGLSHVAVQFPICKSTVDHWVNQPPLSFCLSCVYVGRVSVNVNVPPLVHELPSTQTST